MNQKEICRYLVDRAVVSLWNALRDLSDHEVNDVDNLLLTPEDLKLWGVVTDHPAVQNRLQSAIDKEKEECYNRFID